MKSKIGFDFSLMTNSDLELLAELFEEIISKSKKGQISTRKVPP
jgi:hypothetical protein